MLDYTIYLLGVCGLVFKDSERIRPDFCCSLFKPLYHPFSVSHDQEWFSCRLLGRLLGRHLRVQTPEKLAAIIRKTKGTASAHSFSTL